jgi:N-acyl-D-amino-acid deacylase
MHSHAELEKPHGKTALPFLYQGITTVILGVDGGGSNEIDEVFAVYRRHGIAVNTLHYVGHNAARRAVMGMANRAPTPAELDAMRTYVRKGMEQGALGLSSGLFYSPGSYSTTDEVVELNKVTAPYGGIYDTHDRDLGAAYKGIGYDASVKEAIEIAERAGTPLIFSHFNPQGRRNYGRAPAGAKLIEEARVRGVDVMAAQHVYTATQSSLRAYAVPRWAAAGGRDAMLARFNDRETVARLDVETMEMLDLRGGAEKILFADQRPALNGKTLAQVAEDWNLPVPETVRRIMTEANASVMNLDLYDIDNTRYLAQKEWMMTCTDGRTPPADRQGIVHPRPYGAFSRKLRLFVHEDSIISLQYAVRGMTSLGANFLGIPDRGLIKEGFFADIAVFDEARIRDRATFDDPHQYSEGTVHVLVNGTLAFRDGKPTDALAGRPIKRGGR